MTAAAVPPLALAAAALLAWPGRSAPVAARLRSLRPGASPRGVRRPRGSPAPVSAARRRVLAALAALAVVALLGLPAGVLLAPVAAAAVDRLVRRAGAGAGPSAAVAAEVPVACDLLAVCLGAGAPLTTALGAVGTAVGGAVGHDLAGVAARLRLGSAPRAAWASTAPELAALARVLVRAGESGSGAVPALRALAVDARQGARARAGAAVARSGVWVLAPLGLCFLPAFLCLGVVPLVLGIAHDVFG